MANRNDPCPGGFPRFAIFAALLCALLSGESAGWARSPAAITADFDLASNQLNTALQEGKLFAVPGIIPPDLIPPTV
jgi:hypothetical protein